MNNSRFTPSPLLWHYTKGIHLPKILSDGVINPATAGVPKSEKPIVWFSLNQWWEPTVSAAMGSMKLMDSLVGLARLGVSPDVAPHDWHALKELSGMSSKMAGALYRCAINVGARPAEWRGTFEPVPREKWIAVEVFQEGNWTPLSQAVDIGRQDS